MFGLGCATTRAPYNPQSQLQPQVQVQAELAPVQVMPRGELLFMVLVVLIMVGLVILFFKSNKPKRKKALLERKIRKR